MRVYLVRHFAPLVAAGVCYGRSDIGVDPAVVDAMLPALRAQLPFDAPVYSSPLKRCAQLAVPLSSHPVRFDERLVELDFGTWEMREWAAIEREEIDAWARDTAVYRPGGGESVLGMAHRISDFYAALLREKHPSVVVVCHAGAMRLLAARQQGLAPHDMAIEAARRPHAIGYGEVICLDCV